MGRKKSWSLERAQYINAFSWANWFNRIYDIAISSISWKNLPLTIPQDFIERVLFFNGKILFFEDELMGLTALPFTSESILNVYGFWFAVCFHTYSNPVRIWLSTTAFGFGHTPYATSRNNGSLSVFLRLSPIKRSRHRRCWFLAIFAHKRRIYDALII